MDPRDQPPQVQFEFVGRAKKRILKKFSGSQLAKKYIVEVRDSRTGYLLPARDGPGALPDGQSCWDAVAATAVAVSRKMPKYREMHTFFKIGMSEISRNVNLTEIKAPAGAS